MAAAILGEASKYLSIGLLATTIFFLSIVSALQPADAKTNVEISFVYEDCGLSSAGCGVGTITCADGTTTGPGPIGPAFFLQVTKNPGSPVEGTWAALIPGAADVFGDLGDLKNLSFDGTNFKTKGDWHGIEGADNIVDHSVAICSNDPIDDAKVTFSGQCGGTEIKFEASNGVTATIQGDIICNT